MQLLKNEIINISIKRAKTGKTEKYKYKNRILDNGLNHFLAGRRLDTPTANSLFPNLVSGLGIVFGSIFNISYLKYDVAQNIQDTDTSMLYDVIGINSSETDGNVIIVSSTFDGSKLGGLGFGVIDGISDPAIGSPYWLNSYVDLLFLDIQVFTGDEINIFREDIISTNMNIIEDSFQFMTLPYPASSERYGINKISFSYDVEGSIVDQEYNFSDLTVVRGGVGELIITGFNTFASPQTPGLYPSSVTYPGATTYPSRSPQYKSCVIEYFKTNGSITTKTVTPIRDLDITFDNGTIELRYKIERGQ